MKENDAKKFQDINFQASFSAADIFPAKLLGNFGAIDREGRIRPVHIHLNPTNACNLNCSFCSCAGREKSEALSLEECKDIFDMFASMGTAAATVTGGGEPLMHPEINEILEAARQAKIKCGLVTNGFLLSRLESDWPTWARISISDDRAPNKQFYKTLEAATLRMPNIDWAFSYVYGRKPNLDAIGEAMAFAEGHSFTHMRLVADLFDTENTPLIGDLRSALDGKPGSNLLLYQGRKAYLPGRRFCLISLLKPGITAKGELYPCCGAQYAFGEGTKDYSLTMGHWQSFPRIFTRQLAFDGSGCVRCYYDQYNKALDLLVRDITHREFV